jgi:hypothetical protein
MLLLDLYLENTFMAINLYQINNTILIIHQILILTINTPYKKRRRDCGLKRGLLPSHAIDRWRQATAGEREDSGAHRREKMTLREKDQQRLKMMPRLSDSDSTAAS